MGSAAVVGIDALDVIVEVHVAAGLPQWTLVGLAATAVKESRDRVSAALANAGFTVPPRRITVSLSPGDLPKAGTAFDLPIALGVLAASGQVDRASLRHVRAVGELGLDGTLRPVRGVLAVAQRAVATNDILIVPPANAAEVAWVEGARALAPATLQELVAVLRGRSLHADAQSGAALAALGTSPTAHAAITSSGHAPSPPGDGEPDMSDVVGQGAALRAVEIAAAGGHNLLLIGPPGSGKTMLARRLPGILPALPNDEALEVLAIHSVAGLLSPARTQRHRPFRAPHHSISAAGLIGGGSMPRPGEVSLAHHGVLFLDELSLFPRHVLESLRQPLEDGHVTLARAARVLRFPARFMLVAATNPCPCGYAGDADRDCRCSPVELERHRNRLSGPLADRIDLHVHVRRVSASALDAAAQQGAVAAAARAPCSAVLLERVQAARERQEARYAQTQLAASHRTTPHTPPRSMQYSVRCLMPRTNAAVPPRLLTATAALHNEARALLLMATDRLRLSARGYHRVVRVARTIADLDDASEVAAEHVAEALRFRPVAEPVDPAAAR